MRVKRQQIKIYLEGVEFPGINTVILTEQAGMPPSCELLTSFSSRITDLLPKTLCHVFYWHNDKYILIFSGELTSTTFDKNALQRTCRLQFMATSLNWRNHYLLSKDLKFQLFDEGAFLVLNSDMPYEAKKIEDLTSMELYNVPDYTDTNFDKLKQKFISPITLPNKGTSIHSIRSILKSSLEFPFPEDLFFALMCIESPEKLYFAKNEKSAKDHGVEINYNLANLSKFETTRFHGAGKTHLYNNLNDYDKPPYDLFSRTAWGLLQVMGNYLTLNLTLEECARLINGILYEKYVFLGGITNDYKVFKDEDSDEYYEIPSIEYLAYLQCKAAYGLLIDKFPKSFSPDEPYLHVHPKEMIRQWMGKGTPLNSPYVTTIYEYFQKYRNEIPDKERLIVYNNISTEEENIQVKNYYEKYSAPQWLQTILKGISAVGLVESKIAQTLVENNLSYVISGILETAAYQSTYCHLLYTAEGLNENRIYIFDSKPATTLMQIEGMTNLLLGHVTSYITKATPVMQFIKTIITALGYEILEIATPISGMKNIIITPDTTFMTPILSNTFFPDQINESSYIRNIEQEPTRFISYTTPILGLQSKDGNKGFDFSLVYVTPKIPDMGDEDYIGRNNKQQYTFEECWRGVHGVYETAGETPFEENILRMFENSKTIDDVNYSGIYSSKASGLLSTYWKSMIDGAFLKRRYLNRQAALNVVYSPNRICGFPALVLDEELPSIVGVINSIISTITADGQTISQVSLSHCHTHWDESLEEANITEGIYNYAEDAMPSMEHIWRWLKVGNEQSKYAWYNIGKELYAPMLGLEKDCSILAYASSDLKNSDIIEESSHIENWIYYAKALANGIKNIKDVYKKAYEDSSYIFSDSVISRFLMDEPNFWKWYINDKNGPTLNNYRKAIDTQLLQASSNPNFESYLYKPFIKDRKNKVDAVINANIRILSEELSHE